MIVGESYYDMISDEERSYYDQMYSAIMSQTDCTIQGGRAEGVTNAYRAITMDHPEIVYHPGLFQRLQIGNGFVNALMQYSEPNMDEYNEALDRITQRLWNKVSAVETDYAKYRIIYEYLTGTIEYDMDVFEEYMELSTQHGRRGYAGSNTTLADDEFARVMRTFMVENSNSFTPYGVIVNKKGVCMGIAKAFKILCNYFGLYCLCVEAREKERNVEHLLNIVKINGEPAFVDVTFGLVYESYPAYNYDMFMASRATTDGFYNLTYDFECDNDTLSYHARHGLIFDSVSELRSYLEGYNAEIGDKAVRVRYTGDLLDGEELSKLASDILTYHLSKKHRLRSMKRVRNGFVNILLGDK